METRLNRTLGLSFALGTALALGCEAPGEMSELAGMSEQYNEVRWASTLGGDSVDIAVRELLFPPGWTAPRHFHNSDMFIYVLEGQFEVTMDGAESVSYAAGEAFEMRTEAAMTARNVSGTQALKLVVFQVGQTQAPFAVPLPGSEP